MVTKKKTKFFKSLRFRILVILLILGIVPSVIVTQLMISNYEKQAIEVKVSEVSTQCAILCNQIIKENYLNDSSSQSVNSKLELLSNVYGGRMVIVDRDLKVVADTYHVDEGRTLISPKVVKCFKNGEVTNYRRYGQMLEMAVPVKSADVPQIQGAMLVNISISDIMATVGEQEQMAMLLTGIIVALSVLLAYGLSTILVKPLASVTKSIEDLTDGYQKDEISVPDYTETELITDAFNKMLARMKVLDESRSEFVSNVSHELKTPMTSMKVLADSLVGQEGVPEELYQEFMRDITAEIDREKLNVDMYALNGRVNDLYFGILMLDEQLAQNALLQDELGRNFRQITAYVDNGIANQADLDAVKVEQLNTRQKRVELTSSRMAYLKMLSLLMGEVLSTETVLEKPVPQNELSAVSEIRRPELSWFDAQGAGLQVQEKALNVRHLPHFGLFVQGAYGNPGLNMLKNEFSPYYIAGVRLSWNFGSLYTLKNDRRVIEKKRQQLDNNRDVFLFNTRLEMTQQDQAIRSLEKQMRDDDEIIRLRTNIRRAAEAKVANGTLTVTEMLRELTNESLARQAKAMHEIQRLMGIYQLKYTTNH